MNQLSGQHHRCGSALPLAIGILVLVSAMIAVSTTRGVAVLAEVSHAHDRETALAAVEAVLARHEIAVITRAEAGDPIEFAKWQDNYGSEIFGSCEVRWKVEPVRSAPRDGTSTQIPFLANPPPDISAPAPTTGIKDGAGNPLTANDAAGKPYWLVNDSVYLFRLSAEASVLSRPVADTVDWSTQAGLTRARAQGARYIAINKEPLFRYVIFYAQEGPKGDLELSHGPGINIQGNIHSNGSIYIGADALPASKWDAVRRAPDSEHAYDTQLGPDPYEDTRSYSRGARVSDAPATGKVYYEYINSTATVGKPLTDTGYWRKLDDGRIRVTGVEGVFRLCKPAMYSRFSGFDMDTNTFLPWTKPTGSVAASEYRLTGTSPLDAYDGSGSTVALRTFAGGWVNPYRLTDASKLATVPIDETDEDKARRINNNPITGWGVAGNDARDDGRTDTWVTASPGDAPKGFNGFVRTQATGGRVKRLPDTLGTRPLEAQKLFYPDLYVLNKARLGQKVTQDDLDNPQINAILNGLAKDDVLSMSTPELQAFFTANRERGDAHDLAAPVFFRTGNAWVAGTTYALGAHVLFLGKYYEAKTAHTADLDNSPTGPDTEWAISSAAETSLWNDVSGQANTLEVPGQYVLYAIDGTGTTTAYMCRVMDDKGCFVGWKFTDANGAALTVPAKSGLIIRERPVPDFRYWGTNPAGGYFPDKTTASSAFTPFAYGKHKDVAVWPFTEMWVSNQGIAYNKTALTNPLSTTQYAPAAAVSVAGQGAANAFVKTASATLSTASATQTYTIDATSGGRLTVTAAALRGSSDKIDMTTTVGNKSLADAYGFFRDNWRLIHLKRNNISNAATPAADMTKADTYFSKATFTSVEARLQPDATTGAFFVNAAGAALTGQPLAGLMIRPVTVDGSATSTLDLKANGLNGRSPYVAILYSPGRGIVVQRRTSPSKTIVAIPPPLGYRAYTGINNGTIAVNGSAKIGCLPNPATVAANSVIQQAAVAGRRALTEPTWDTVVTPADTGKIRSPLTGYTLDASSTSKGVAYPITLVKPGETSVSQTFNLVRGPWTVTDKYTASRTWNKYNFQKVLTLGQDGYLDLQVTGSNTTLTTFKTSAVGFADTSGNITWPVATANGSRWEGKAFWLNPNTDSSVIPTAAGQAITGNTVIPRWVIPGALPPADPGNTTGAGFVADDRLRFRYPVTLATGSSTFIALSTTSTPKTTDVGLPAGNYIMTQDPKSTSTLPASITPLTWKSNDAGAPGYGSETLFSDQGDYAAAVAYMGGWDNLKAKLSGITQAENIGVATHPTTPTGTDYPTDASLGTPAPAAPTHPAAGTQTQPQNLGVTKYRIAITRETASAAAGASNAAARCIETNSWISARGTWAPTPGGSTADDFVRFQKTDDATNNKERIGSNTLGDQVDVPVMTSVNVGTSESLRPDYWSGPLKTTAASWSNMYSPTDATNGSIVPGSTVTGYPGATADYPTTTTTATTVPNYLNATGSAELKLWEDTQIPYWTGAATTAPIVTYVPENTATSQKASAVIYSGILYICKAAPGTGAGTSNKYRPDFAGSAYWDKVTDVRMRIKKTGNALTFEYYLGVNAPTAAWQWREVTEARLRTADYMADVAKAGNLLTSTDCTTWDDRWVVGPALQSGSATTTATAVFSNLKVTTSEAVATNNDVIDSNDWDASVVTEKQVSPSDGSKLAGRTANNATKYLCSQYQAFWGPTEITEDFFSWTNGTGLDSSRNATELWFYNPREFWSQSAWWNEGDLGTDWLPVNTPWTYKETGTTTAPAAYPIAITTATTWIERAGRTTALNISLANVQAYIAARSLKDATYKWSADTTTATATATLKSMFTGLIYAARTNRYPRNPLPAQDNPWNPDLPNGNSATVSLTDLYDGLAANTDLRDRLMPDCSAAVRPTVSPPLCAPIRSRDFHHGVMISDASAVTWGYSTPKVFGESKTSIVTPNQLYLRGNVNNTEYSLKETPTSSLTRNSYTPMAVMGDSVTLLSTNWVADTSAGGYCRPGLFVDSSGVKDWTSASTLSDLQGASAATTSYRTCILTNNQPTTRYRAFQDEGAPFINTMLYLEDWSDQTMNFTGSLVVLDSCRYTSSFLLQNAKTSGRSPFGTMGYHADATWKPITGWTAAAGTPDWCKIGAVKQPPSGTANSSTTPFGTIPVYKPPTRNMSFNGDLLSEQGTPPNTPFGVTAAGVAGWSRVLQ